MRRHSDLIASPRWFLLPSGPSLLALLLASLLPACSRTDDSSQVQAPTTSAPTPAAAPPPQPPPVDPEASARYSCDGSNWVDIVRDRIARVSLSDGRKLEIQVVDDSKPRTFMGDGLTLVETGEGSAELSDETNRTLICKTES